MRQRNANAADISQHLSVGKVGSSARRMDLAGRFSHLFWCGDLNYRVDLPRADVLKHVKARDWRGLHASDELSMTMARGEAFYCFREGRLDFPPTFKHVHGEGPTRNHHYTEPATPRSRTPRGSGGRRTLGSIADEGRRGGLNAVGVAKGVIRRLSSLMSGSSVASHLGRSLGEASSSSVGEAAAPKAHEEGGHDEAAAGRPRHPSTISVASSGSSSRKVSLASSGSSSRKVSVASSGGSSSRKISLASSGASSRASVEPSTAAAAAAAATAAATAAACISAGDAEEEEEREEVVVERSRVSRVTEEEEEEAEEAEVEEEGEEEEEPHALKEHYHEGHYTGVARRPNPDPELNPEPEPEPHPDPRPAPEPEPDPIFLPLTLRRYRAPFRALHPPRLARLDAHSATE